MDKARNKYYHDKRWFGGHRDEMLKRDGGKCVICGSIDVIGHHKDGKGRRHPNPNSALDNLQTLCRSCHAKLHASKISKDIVFEVMRNWDWSDCKLAVLTGLSHPTIRKVRKQVLEILELGPAQNTAIAEQAYGERRVAENGGKNG